MLAGVFANLFSNCFRPGSPEAPVDRTSEVVRQWNFGCFFTILLAWSHSQCLGGSREIGG